MGDVRVAHQQAMVADDRRVARLHRPMDRHVLADGVAGADDNVADLLRQMGVLGQSADDRALEEVVVLA